MHSHIYVYEILIILMKSLKIILRSSRNIWKLCPFQKQTPNKIKPWVPFPCWVLILMYDYSHNVSWCLKTTTR